MRSRQECPGARTVSRAAVVVSAANRSRDGESARPEPWSRSRGPPRSSVALWVILKRVMKPEVDPSCIPVVTAAGVGCPQVQVVE